MNTTRRALLTTAGLVSVSGCLSVGAESDGEPAVEIVEIGDSPYITGASIKFRPYTVLFQDRASLVLELPQEPPEMPERFILFKDEFQAGVEGIDIGQREATFDVSEGVDEFDRIIVHKGGSADFQSVEGGEILDHIPVSLRRTEVNA